MFNEFVEWLRLILGTKYQYSRGMWVDSPALVTARIAAIYAMGGPQPDVDDRRPRFRVLLLGPQNGRQYAADIQTDMELLMQAVQGDLLPCGAASVLAIGEPAGPAYTTENRPWMSLDFQVTF